MPFITTSDFSSAVGTTAQTVLTAAQVATFRGIFLRIVNVSTTATIWLNRNGPAVVNGPGSYPLAPGQIEIYQGGNPVPDNVVSAIATGTGGALTIEAV